MRKLLKIIFHVFCVNYMNDNSINNTEHEFDSEAGFLITNLSMV